jgi:hypothetical protein
LNAGESPEIRDTAARWSDIAQLANDISDVSGHSITGKFGHCQNGQLFEGDRRFRVVEDADRFDQAR